MLAEGKMKYQKTFFGCSPKQDYLIFSLNLKIRNENFIYS